MSNKDDICHYKIDKCEKEKNLLIEQIVKNETEINNQHKQLTEKLVKLLQSHTNSLLQQLESEKLKAMKEIETKKEDVSREHLMLELQKIFTRSKRQSNSSRRMSSC